MGEIKRYNSLEEIAEELDIKTNNVVELLKEIGKKLRLPEEAEVGAFHYWYVNEGSFARSCWYVLGVKGDGRIAIYKNCDYSGRSPWIAAYLEEIDKIIPNDNRKYEMIDNLSYALLELINKSISKAIERGKNLDEQTQKLKEILDALS